MNLALTARSKYFFLWLVLLFGLGTFPTKSYAQG
jgi:hypothetical protein